jgi:hypothetical protein
LCHGMNARTPTDAGRWMYPRDVDLTSSDAQGYTYPELFWIVKNCIRLSGRPHSAKSNLMSTFGRCSGLPKSHQ